MPTRISMDDLEAASKPSGKPGKASAKADASADPLAKVKLGAAVFCLVVAGYILGGYLGYHEFWPWGAPAGPKLTPEQAAAQQAEIKRFEEEQKREEERIQALPENERPIRAGS